MADLPDIAYTRAGGVHIAYEVFGDGPIDVMLVPAWASNLEIYWEEPRAARMNRRLAAFSRVIAFDKRGTGLSDRPGGAPTLEQRMDDVSAVMDAADCERAALIGFWEGGPMSALFAATYPERVRALVLWGTMPAYTRSAACPWAPTPAEHEALAEAVEQSWGQGLSVDLLAPSLAGDAEFRRFWARLERHSVSPGGAVELYRLNSAIDITAVLPTIRVPTLVLHRTGDRMVPIGAGRYTADHIPGAAFVELAGDDHLTFVGDADAFVGEVEEFLTGTREPPDADRVLATVLFTDIVRSTEEIVARGDRAWRELLEAHHRLVRRELRRFRGQEIDTAGDGFLATFDGPARAIRCAQAIVDTLRGVGLQIRAGLHTGEVEMRNGGIGGIAVHIGARVAALAGASEILVSRTVRDLTAGAGITYSPRGSHQLKGVPDEWELYAVDSTGSAVAV